MRIVRATIDYPGRVKTVDEDTGAKVGTKETRPGHRNAVAILDDGTRVHLHDKGWRHMTTAAGKKLAVPQLHRYRNNWIISFPRRGEVVYGILDDRAPRYGKHPELVAWCRADSYEKPLRIIAAQQDFTNQDLIAGMIIGLINDPHLNLVIWKHLMLAVGCSKRFVAAVLAHYYVGMPASQVNIIFAPS